MNTYTNRLTGLIGSLELTIQAFQDLIVNTEERKRVNSTIKVLKKSVEKITQELAGGKKSKKVGFLNETTPNESMEGRGRRGRSNTPGPDKKQNDVGQTDSESTTRGNSKNRRRRKEKENAELLLEAGKLPVLYQASKQTSQPIAVKSPEPIQTAPGLNRRRGNSY